MDRAVALQRLQSSEPELRELGLTSLSLFGSTARGDAGDTSDIDLAATFDDARQLGLFGYAAVIGRLSQLVGAPVDLVGEPARKPTLQHAIDRDRVRVF